MFRRKRLASGATSRGEYRPKGSELRSGVGSRNQTKKPEPPHVPSLDPKEAVCRSEIVVSPLAPSPDIVADGCLPVGSGHSAQALNDDVHIKPNVQPATPVPSNGILDASLKTHTKPYKVNVNLVLCR